MKFYKIELLDNIAITFGDGPDGKILSDGTSVVIKSGDGTETMARFTQNGTSQLYYDNALQLQTFTNGFGFGQTTSYLKTSSGANAIEVVDGGRVQLYYNGSGVALTNANGITGAVYN